MVDGTATAGRDQLAGSGAFTFAIGETVKTVAITINGDAIAEQNETSTTWLCPVEFWPRVRKQWQCVTLSLTLSFGRRPPPSYHQFSGTRGG
jgi:hypothetical protein